MNLEIIYNGTDVTKSIDLKKCITTDRYGGMADSIQLSINDADKVWAGHGVEKGDEIIVKTDGYSTGTMYLTKTDMPDRVLNIDAVSLKPSKKVVKSRLWRNVKLSEILSDCAIGNGLTLKTYGLIDYTYEAIAQIHKTDLEFVSMVCQREGYSVKVDNQCLVVFNEKYIESQNADITITPNDVDSNYYFIASSDCVNNVTISYYDPENGLIEQTATDDNIAGGSKVINERVYSIAEAVRFAYGYLRALNKKYIVGYLTMPYNAKISAGTVLNIEGFKAYDGKYVVIEISHNLINETSKITVRKTLNY